MRVRENTRTSAEWQKKFGALQAFQVPPPPSQRFCSSYLQREGENHVGLGQRVLVLLAHVNDGGVVAPLQLLQLELSALGHGHALQVGHQLVHRRLELLDVHGLHFFRDKFGELARLPGDIYSDRVATLREECGRTRSNVDTAIFLHDGLLAAHSQGSRRVDSPEQSGQPSEDDRPALV